MDWQNLFGKALDYQAFLDTHGSPVHRERWRAFYEQAQLSDAQRALLGGFTRQMNILCLAGAWCGDCVNQCPILQRFSEENPLIQLRFFDRDTDPGLRDALSINGGQRVPVVIFLSEDFMEAGRYGDRTLSTYRRMAQAQLGPACPTGLGATGHLIQAVTQEWLDEFERIQLMLRLSSRLRSMHGD